MRKLPPLNALRAFDAAARHMSFKDAAEELSVTQAAVSHQVKALEDYLGVPLFIRLNRALELSSAGKRYFPEVRKSFDALRAATTRLLDDSVSGPLTVSVLPSFATRWLVPRLGRFSRQHPNIDLFIAPDRNLTDYSRSSVDVGIRYGRERADAGDLHSELILRDEMFPVCSPALLARHGTIKEPEQIAALPLLHDEDEGDWTYWFDKTAVDPKNFENIERGPVFLDASMMIQAAVDGLGIALARTSLVKDELESGRLIRVFDKVLPNASNFAYYLEYPQLVADKPRIIAFRDWLLQEIARDSEANPSA